MATITKRGTFIFNASGKTSISNISNITDNDDASYATVSKTSSSTLVDIVVGGFDFTEIPDGSVINSFSLKSYCGLDSDVSCILFAIRKYKNGSFKDASGNAYGGTSPQASFGSAGTLKINTFTENVPFSAFAGFMAEDINKSWTSEANYTGIAFYIRYKGLTSSSKKAYPRYFDLTVDYTPPKITVATGVNPTGSGTVTGGGTYESGSTVTATATPNTGYAFSHWLINGANAGSSNPISGALTSDTTVTAVFEKIKYTIRWYNEDETFLEEDTVEYGVTPTYDSAIPTKPSTAQYTYTFKGWHIEVTTVTASIDYYARYTETINKYTVLWKNDDGTVLEEDTTEYGVTPTYDSAIPTKPSTVQYTYTFIGWDTAIEEVTKNVTYTAVYMQDVNIYTIEGLSNEGGYVVGGGSFAYGSTTILTAKPYDGYKFVSWSDGYIFPGRTVEVLGDATYTAIFEKIDDSKVYKGTKPVSVYKGNKKVSVYIGTTKIYG